MNPSSPTGAMSLPKLSGYNLKLLPNYTPQQMGLHSSQFSPVQQGTTSGLDYLSKLASGDESAFQDMEAPAFSAFDKLLGQTASRFSQFGGRDSSAFQNMVAGQGAELAQGLQAQRSSLQRDAIQRLLEHSNTLLNQNPYQLLTQQQKPKTDWGGLLGAVLPSLLSFINPGLGAAAGLATNALGRSNVQTGANPYQALGTGQIGV